MARGLTGAPSASTHSLVQTRLMRAEKKFGYIAKNILESTILHSKVSRVNTVQFICGHINRSRFPSRYKGSKFPAVIQCRDWTQKNEAKNNVTKYTHDEVYPFRICEYGARMQEQIWLSSPNLDFDL